MTCEERTPEQQAAICRHDLEWHGRKAVEEAERVVSNLRRALYALEEEMYLNEGSMVERVRRAFQNRDVKDFIGGDNWSEYLRFRVDEISGHLDGYDSNQQWLEELEKSNA
jgi:hypothetical protein